MLQKKPTNNLGRIAEDFAASLLQEKSYKILERNFRSRFGEIDVVAEKDGVLVFVEVKARWSRKFGTPEEAVTPWKLKKIQKTGEYYSILHPTLSKKLRIVVVALEIDKDRVISSKIIEVY